MYLHHPHVNLVSEGLLLLLLVRKERERILLLRLHFLVCRYIRYSLVLLLSLLFFSFFFNLSPHSIHRGKPLPLLLFLTILSLSFFFLSFPFFLLPFTFSLPLAFLSFFYCPELSFSLLSSRCVNANHLNALL